MKKGQAVYEVYRRWTPDDPAKWLVNKVELVNLYPSIIKLKHNKSENLKTDISLLRIEKESPLKPIWRATEAVFSKKRGAPGNYLMKKIQGKAFDGLSQYIQAKFFGNGRLKITEIKAVYNPMLVARFNYKLQTLTQRLQQHPPNREELSFQQKWILNQYEKRADEFFWNHEGDSPIKVLPLLHGTGMNVAEGICSSGFASLALLDAGWFGQGMYFTTNSVYTLSYCGTREVPVIILCFVIMGNVFPVASQTDFYGKRLASGYNSHYVVTNPSGKISTSITGCDEIVIDQEDQVIPAYILTIDKASINSKLADSMWLECPKSVRDYQMELLPEEAQKRKILDDSHIKFLEIHENLFGKCP